MGKGLRPSYNERRKEGEKGGKDGKKEEQCGWVIGCQSFCVVAPSVRNFGAKEWVNTVQLTLSLRSGSPARRKYWC